MKAFTSFIKVLHGKISSETLEQAFHLTPKHFWTVEVCGVPNESRYYIPPIYIRSGSLNFTGKLYKVSGKFPQVIPLNANVKSLL